MGITMKQNLISILLAAVLGMLPAKTFATVQYTITDLGTLGGERSYAYAVNNSGRVVGWSEDANDDIRAFLWENGIMHDLGTLGGERSEAWGINDLGQVAGWSTLASGETRGFLWLPEPAYGFPAGMNELDTLGGPFGWAYGINDLGQVIGVAYDSDELQHAFLFSNGTMTDLGTLGGYSSIGHSINNLGQAVGFSESEIGGPLHAFLWLPEAAYGLPSGLNDLGTLGGDASAALGISDKGEVLATVRDPDTGDRHAILWKNGVALDLGSLGGTRCIPRAINRWGCIVGSSGLTPGLNDPHAFIYRDSLMNDLNDLIPQNSGWELLLAADISDSGRIAGRGAIGDELHAYLLTPIPEPSTLGLVGLTLLFAARRQQTRRRIRLS